MRFLRVIPHFLAAEVDERIELLRGLRHEVHGQRVPLGLVFDLTERVDGVVKDVLRAAEAAVGVGDLYAQTLVRIIGVAGARCGLLHFVGGLLEAVLDAVHGDVREVRHVIELLHGVGRHAGHGGEREQIVCIRGCFLRHGDQRLFRLDDGRRDGGKAARQRQRRRVKAPHGVHGGLHAVRQLDAELGRQAVHHVTEVAHLLAGFLNFFLVFVELVVEVVEVGLCVVETCLPLHCALVCLAVFLGGLLQGGTQILDLFGLRGDLALEHVVFGVQCLDAVGVLRVGRLHLAHLRVQDVHTAADLGDGLLVFFLARKRKSCVDVGHITCLR